MDRTEQAKQRSRQRQTEYADLRREFDDRLRKLEREQAKRLLDLFQEFERRSRAIREGIDGGHRPQQE
jgi:hypothetical protein